MSSEFHPPGGVGEKQGFWSKFFGKDGDNNLKKVIIAMLLMTIFMVGGGGFVSVVFTSILGGGVEQSYIYPIYGAIIVLTGIIVGATQKVVVEITELKKSLKDKE